MYRNLILITIDALRYDYFNKYVFRRTFKTLKDATIFKNAYAQSSSTPPSFVSIFTSTYPLVLGYSKLSYHVVTLAEILKEHNFMTCGITHNPYHSVAYGYDRGFDLYYDFRVKERSFYEILNMYGLKSLVRILLEYSSHKLIYRSEKPYFSAEVLTSLAKYVLRKFKKDKIERFFLWIHYMDLHAPITFPSIRKQLLFDYDNAQFEDRTVITELYRRQAEELDRCLGEFLATLEDLHLMESTVIVITSDHGEELFDHGMYGHWPRFYEELIHIPLLIRAPSVLTKKVFEGFVEHVDILPTLIHLLGLRINNKLMKQIMGINIVDLVYGSYNKGYVISELGHVDPKHVVKEEYYRWCVRTKIWKLIYWPSRGKVILYNLARDPQERINIAQENRDIVESLVEVLRNHIRKEISRRISIKLKDKIMNF